MRDILLISTFIILAAVPVRSDFERGALPVVNYTSAGDYRADRDAWSTVRSRSGIMYFANSEGVLQYNGVTWNLIRLPNRTSVQSLAIDRDGKFEYSPEVEVTITAVPARFELAQNFPNPFNPETTLRVALPVAGHITLSVYDLLGREVALLMNEWMEAGMHAVRFNGAGLASGLYLARLSDGNAVHLRKMQLMK